MVQLSHLYMTTGKTIAFTRWTFVGKVHQTIILMNCCPHHTQLHIYSWIIISQSARAIGSNSLPLCTNSLHDNSSTESPTAPANTFWGQGTHISEGWFIPSLWSVFAFRKLFLIFLEPKYVRSSYHHHGLFCCSQYPHGSGPLIWRIWRPFVRFNRLSCCIGQDHKGQNTDPKGNLFIHEIGTIQD